MLDPQPPAPAESLYGLLAQFGDADALLEAAHRAHVAGYRKIDAHSPFPIDGLREAMGVRNTRLPWIVFGGGVFGCLAGYLMQYYSASIAYPINVGGRPYNSWPAFIPITFECTILAAAVAAVVGMLALNRLPMPVHPLFHVDTFARMSQDRFFLSIESIDPRFNLVETRQFLESLRPERIDEVPR